MVVDEELKMMCDICHEGGQVLGPVPQADEPPGAHRVPPRRPHRRDVREVLRRHMYAATVTGLAGLRTPAG
jgi:phenazine biosynthesis protein phzE